MIVDWVIFFSVFWLYIESMAMNGDCFLNLVSCSFCRERSYCTQDIDDGDTSCGDLFDISLLKISHLRYKQNHEWMEEILSSPYSLNQIIPFLSLGETLRQLSRRVLAVQYTAVLNDITIVSI